MHISKTKRKHTFLTDLLRNILVMSSIKDYLPIRKVKETGRKTMKNQHLPLDITLTVKMQWHKSISALQQRDVIPRKT